MKKSIKIIFTLSILLNLALLGLVGAGAYKRYQWHHHAMPTLSAESQTILQENMEQVRAEMKEHFQQMRAQHEVLKDIVTAAEFDRVAYDHAVEDVLQSKDVMAKQKAARMGDILAKMPQQDREKFARKMLRGLVMGDGARHGGGKKGHKRPPTD